MNCANHPDRERVSFCQNCGKPLCTECTRTIGTAVFCEPCLAARLAAADTATSAAGTPYGYAGEPGYAPAIPPVPGAPNPVFAALLGLIPGVGAMYNGQYAKGIVHLIVFAVLVSLSDSNGIFGLFIAGWVCYQVIEAHHTARARRDGTPLPNPFGLNDIGDRLGFGRSWTGVPHTPPAPGAPSAGNPAYQPSAGTPYTHDASGGFSHANTGQGYTAPPPPSASNWGAPAESYAYTAPPIPPVPPFGAPFAGEYPDPAASRNRFPAGAVWLIALGLLFFFGSSGWFLHFPIQRLIPFFLIALGLWLFYRKMTNSGLGLADDGSPGYRLRVFRALRGAIWVILVGVLFFLDTFDILSWGHSWPLFIIVAGLMTILERSIYSSAASIPYSYPSPGQGPSGPGFSGQAAPAPTPTPASGTSIVPVTPRDEEGR